MNTILVQATADIHWTEEALHLACAMAQHNQANIVMLYLLPTQHYSWLGANLGNNWLTVEQTEQLWGYKEIAANYGIDLSVQPMEYVSYAGALVDICEQLGVTVAFAHVPDSAIPLWRKVETWDLRRQLSARQIGLYTLDEPVQSMVLTAQIGLAVPQAHA